MYNGHILVFLKERAILREKMCESFEIVANRRDISVIKIMIITKTKTSIHTNKQYEKAHLNLLNIFGFTHMNSKEHVSCYFIC